MKNAKSKTIKIGKQPKTTYRLGCKIILKILGPQEVKMTDEVLREKSHCVVCRSNKSRFLKQKLINN